MKHKTIHISEDCLGAVKTALRVRIIYLQGYRQDAERRGEKQAAEAITQDIANLTMIADRLDETPLL